jgi:hypothetical protein
LSLVKKISHENKADGTFGYYDGVQEPEKWILKFEILRVPLIQILIQKLEVDGILLSAYMKYIRESIGFTPKILKNFFCSKHVFYR